MRDGEQREGTEQESFVAAIEDAATEKNEKVSVRPHRRNSRSDRSQQQQEVSETGPSSNATPALSS